MTTTHVEPRLAARDMVASENIRTAAPARHTAIPMASPVANTPLDATTIPLRASTWGA
mgnify:CR=1 FL=1